MATAQMGFLQEVDIHTLWDHEQYDFSNWLAKKENLEQLNNTLGIILGEVEKEVYVGSFRCDLMGIDEVTGDKIIIENQLEQSNHEHLGKLITYASGLNASIIVWIVRNARDEHKSAIEWLNNNTPSTINFFLIEIHAYKIGNSLPAPKFEVIEKPNDFIKNAKGSSGTGEINKSQAERLNFWTRFNEILMDRGKPFNIRKPTMAHWYNIALGTRKARVSLGIINKDKYASVELYIPNDKDLFDKLFSLKNEIEGKLHLQLDWQRLDDKTASRIIYRIPGLDFDDHSNYDELMSQMIDTADTFIHIFKKYIK